MTMNHLVFRPITLCSALLSLALIPGCPDGNGGDVDGGTDAGDPPATYSIGGTLTGLIGELVLQNEGANDLALTADGAFTVASEVADGTSYDVTLLSWPLLQNCSVTGAQGTVDGADVDTIVVTCEDKTWHHPTALDQNISPSGTSVVDPQVAMNADGDAVVAWVQSEGSDRQTFVAERDAGTWTHPTALTEFVNPPGGFGVDTATPAALGINAAGDAILAWAQGDGSTDCGGAECLQIYRSTRTAGVWTHPSGLGSRVSLPGARAYDPQAVIDDAGNISIVYVATEGGTCDGFSCTVIYLGERRDGVWREPSDMATGPISPGIGRARGPLVATDRDGNRVVSWRETDDLSDCGNGYACFQTYLSQYRGGAWTHPSNLQEGIAPPGQAVLQSALTVSPAGEALVVWQQSNGTHMQLYRSIYTNGSWTHPISILDSLGPAGENGSDPLVAMDAEGQAVLVWQQSDGSNRQLYASMFSGGVWSAAERLSLPGTDVIGSGSRQTDASLAMDDHGNVIVAWAQEDESTDCGSSACTQIYLSEYRRGMWHHPESLADHASLAGENAEAPDLATDDHGNAVLVYQQGDGLAGCTEGYCLQTFVSEYR